MKISALFFFILLLTSLVALPPSIAARDLKGTDSEVQPQAGADLVTGPRTGSSGRREIPCYAGPGKIYTGCNSSGVPKRCSTYSRSCPP